MRLDKYLKVSRIIKRRTLAKDVCDQGRVSINGHLAKASSEVKIGDLITLRLGQKELTAKVLDVKENPRKEEADLLYEIVSEKRIETNESEDLPAS
jgi:ribosomal 50S subunit-recycling heat shock protein